MASKIGKRFTSIFAKKDPGVTIKHPSVGLLNILTENWRGIIGTIPLIILLPIFLTDLKNRPDNTVKVIWLAMFWLLLLHPVNVPVTGMVPVFAFPCLHVISSDQVCSQFFNPTMVLFIVGGYVLMLLNNSGFDKRVIIRLLTLKKGNLSSNSLLIRSSFAAFLMSMFSNRLMVTSAVMDYVNGPLKNLQNTAEERGSRTDYKAIRYIMCNAIATSSSIGSIAILHASYSAMAKRTVWELHGATPDVFNFLQYSIFALPVAIIMFLLNLAYHIALIKFVVKTPISQESLNTIGKDLMKAKGNIPRKITLHELLSIIALVFALILYYLRWSEVIKKFGNTIGWAGFQKLDKLNNPQIADATVSCLFALLLHMIPKSYGFTKYFKRKLRKSELPLAKPESSVLLWQFVNRNTNYGYIILIGGGIALNTAISQTGLFRELQEKGTFITGQNWNVGIGIICLLSVILCNIMTSVAALLMILPFILNMVVPNTLWEERLHLCALAVGIGCSFGFALPFRYTPAYYVKKIGKVPLLEQMKYAIGSVIICFLVLWVSLCFYGDPVFVGDTRIASTTLAPITTKKYL